MCYDYHGSWDEKTSHNAPLYASFGEGSIQSSIDYYLEKGVPARKLVMGLPTYGRTFLLSEDVEDGPALGKPAGKVGFSGPYTNEPGFLGYNEVRNSFLREFKIMYEISVSLNSSSFFLNRSLRSFYQIEVIGPRFGMITPRSHL